MSREVNINALMGLVKKDVLGSLEKMLDESLTKANFFKEEDDCDVIDKVKVIGFMTDFPFTLDLYGLKDDDIDPKELAAFKCGEVHVYYDDAIYNHGYAGHIRNIKLEGENGSCTLHFESTTAGKAVHRRYLEDSSGFELVLRVIKEMGQTKYNYRVIGLLMTKNNTHM